jgi:hypothetical protein
MKITRKQSASILYNVLEDLGGSAMKRDVEVAYAKVLREFLDFDEMVHNIATIGWGIQILQNANLAEIVSHGKSSEWRLI